MATQQNRKGDTFWDTHQAVTEFSQPFRLHLGEQTAFASCFPDGMFGHDVLDLGCGTGRTTYYLDQMGANVTGVDASPAMIEAAQKRLPDIIFYVSDAANLDFQDEIFNLVVFSFNGLDYLYPLDMRHQTIDEIYRVLKPGGKFILSSHNLLAMFLGWYKCMRPSKLKHRVKNILNKNAFKKEAYIHDPVAGNTITYYGQPNQVVSSMRAHGFKLVRIDSNIAPYNYFDRYLKTTSLTKLSDPWPYYTFQKEQ